MHGVQVHDATGASKGPLGRAPVQPGRVVLGRPRSRVTRWKIRQAIFRPAPHSRDDDAPFSVH